MTVEETLEIAKKRWPGRAFSGVTEIHGYPISGAVLPVIYKNCDGVRYVGYRMDYIVRGRRFKKVETKHSQFASIDFCENDKTRAIVNDWDNKYRWPDYLKELAADFINAYNLKYIKGSQVEFES
jgi:hypothetical protein